VALSVAWGVLQGKAVMEALMYLRCATIIKRRQNRLFTFGKKDRNRGKVMS
jgi:hypothetical protein